MIKSKLFKQVLVVLGLVLLAVIARVLMQGLPNIEPITAVALLGVVVFRGKWAWLLPLAIVAVSDVIIGNTSILLFTWSAWAMVGLFSLILKKAKANDWGLVFKFTGTGLVANLIFYLWTNFGVWLIGNMYPKTVSGLVESYIMGLPFLKYQLLGNLIILPAVATSLVFAKKYFFVFKTKYAN